MFQMNEVIRNTAQMSGNQEITPEIMQDIQDLQVQKFIKKITDDSFLESIQEPFIEPTTNQKSISKKKRIRKSSSYIGERPNSFYFGNVLEIIDGVAWVNGIQSVGLGHTVEIQVTNSNKFITGLVLSLNTKIAGILLLASEALILPGAVVRSSGQFPLIKVGPSLLGSVVDSLTNRLEAANDAHKNWYYNDFDNAPTVPLKSVQVGIIERKSVHQSLLTGIKAIDSMVPIGRGQRELIIGDRQTGKSTIAIDTILNQTVNYDFTIQKEYPWWAQLLKNSKFKNKSYSNVTDKIFSIYVGIGQKKSTIKQFLKILQSKNALFSSLVVLSAASDPAALQYLAPYTGCTIAEWFSFRGLHSLIIYDDLSKHAVAYRQISLLLRRSPGREAYPGDVFFLHSRLLERAAKFNNFYGGGSLTALPIIETQIGDVSAYIPTNVISITDGQIFLEFDLFHKGIRPAVNAGLSVSRVGSTAQSKRMRKLASSLKLELAQYREVEVFSKFASNLDKATQAILLNGEKLVQILKQSKYSPLELGLQILLIYASVKKFFSYNFNNLMIGKFENFLISQCRRYRSYAVLILVLESKYKLDDPKKEDILLNSLLNSLIKKFKILLQ